MNKFAKILCAGLLSSLPALAVAGQKPVVLVELFTSQGCSSCPPADAFLEILAEKNDVLPLAMHVDYWDYIGWKDIFADPFFTERQKAYARRHNSKSIYTPQAIVNGAQGMVGSDQMSVVEAIIEERNNLADIELTAEHDGTQWRFEFLNNEPTLQGVIDVNFITFMEHADVEIKSGENSGKTIRYTNIVSCFQPLATEKLRQSWVNFAKFPKNGNYAVILQAGPGGRVIASYRVQ